MPRGFTTTPSVIGNHTNTSFGQAPSSFAFTIAAAPTHALNTATSTVSNSFFSCAPTPTKAAEFGQAHSGFGGTFPETSPATLFGRAAAPPTPVAIPPTENDILQQILCAQEHDGRFSSQNAALVSALESQIPTCKCESLVAKWAAFKAERCTDDRAMTQLVMEVLDQLFAMESDLWGMIGAKSVGWLALECV